MKKPRVSDSQIIAALKRVYRIYRALELNLRIKPKRRLVRAMPDARTVPEQVNQVWSGTAVSAQARQASNRSLR